MSRMSKGFQALVPGKSKKITVTGTSAVSDAFTPNTTAVRLIPTENCWAIFGTGAGLTAVADDGNSFYCQGGVIQILGVPEGANRIAAIQVDTNGELHILEGA